MLFAKLKSTNIHIFGKLNSKRQKKERIRKKEKALILKREKIFIVNFLQYAYICSHFRCIFNTEYSRENTNFIRPI